MKIFLSHNKSDVKAAHAMAEALTAFGQDVWFDEWVIRPGESIVEGIEDGIRNYEIFILMWSINAQKSSWVGTEHRAALWRKVNNKSLRIIPIILDDTPLPALLAEYKGFRLEGASKIIDVAYAICGRPTKEQTIGLLHRLLIEKMHGDKDLCYQPLAIFCERCYSTNLEHSTATDEYRDDLYYCVQCKDCGWSDGTEV